jgi:hypothetical protein
MNATKSREQSGRVNRLPDDVLLAQLAVQVPLDRPWLQDFQQRVAEDLFTTGVLIPGNRFWNVRVFHRDIRAYCAHISEFASQMRPQAQIAAVPH